MSGRNAQSASVGSARRVVCRSKWVGSAFLALAILVLSPPTLRIVMHGEGSLSLFTDDFFYYLKIGENIAKNGHSTFNEIVNTNGYHPLWMLIIAGSQAIGMGSRVVYLVAVCFALGGLLTFLAARRMGHMASGSDFVAGLTGVFATQIFCTIAPSGMEVIIAVPAALWFCSVACSSEGLLRERWPTFFVFLLGSLAILCRVDLVILVIMVGLVSVFRVRSLGVLSPLAALAGLLPAILYFAFNWIVFSTFLPVSGEAKQLRQLGAPVMSPFLTWLTSKNMLMIAAVFLSAVGVILSAVVLKRPNGPVRPWVWACMSAFPFVFALAVSCKSDWPIWRWYFYPCVIGATGAACIVAEYLKTYVERWRDAGWTFASAGVGIALGLIFVAYAVLSAKYAKWAIESWRLPAHSSYDVGSLVNSGFAAAHPGVYAMGDGAGSVGYVLSSPVVQLEGLVMDARFLENIRQERPLEEVLREYGVDYFISDQAEREGDCYKFREPALAGPLSPAMRATICTPPVWSEEYGKSSDLRYSLRIFKVS